MRPGSLQRLARSLRKILDDAEGSAGTFTVHDDCPECGARISFEFLDVPHRQTRYSQCWKCGEVIRMVRSKLSQTRLTPHERN